MELYFNECSIHGQFSNIQAFVNALDTLMEIRNTAKKYNRELYCHRNCQQKSVTHQFTLSQAIQHIDKNKVRVLMGWLAQAGPYWEDTRKHSSDEFLECQGEIVTDTAIGEAAFLVFFNKQAQLASMTSSNWTNTPLSVIWHKNDSTQRDVSIVNHISAITLDKELKNAEPPIQSWEHMSQICLRKFENLDFSKEAFVPLKGVPFVLSAANNIVDLLDVLSRFKAAHEHRTGRSQQGHELYQKFFTGERAWFTDSSAKEKVDFKNEMTFTNPVKPNENIFATFHGKVQTPQLRIHFSWPITADTPLFILYVGEKITKY